MKTTKAKTPTSAKRRKRKRAVLYARVDCHSGNTKKAAESQIEQIKELRNYCEAENIEVVQVYHDVGSGLHFNRPEYRKFYKALKQGRLEADYFFFTTIDRFSRRLDNINSMTKKLKELGIIAKAIRDVRVVYFAALEVLKTKYKDL